VNPRPTKRVISLELTALFAAVVVAVAANDTSNWDLPLFFVLLALSVVSDLTALDTPTSRLKISSSFLAIVTAIVFLGPTPAAVIGVATIAAGWVRFRYPRTILLINVVTFAAFPLLAGIPFDAILRTADTGHSAGFYALIFGLFVVALMVNFVLIAGYFSYVEADRFADKVRRALLPLLPLELASAFMAVGAAYFYVEFGLSAIALIAVVLIIFQHLLGALVLSQQRADELELRAKQLAGFQVALLAALVRTLDLRDRMTARHSAAVARYSREIAAAAGLSQADQELVHTAGLLHDIGKFVLPDHLLKPEAELTESDWEEIRGHPYEGARIVSQIDGYQPVGQIVLAHHERVDGLGYPRGLRGEEIPVLARIVAVANAYDVLTARDASPQAWGRRGPMSWFEAITELRRLCGTQLDGRFVDALIDVLADKGFSYRHGEDADFEAELALDKRIHEYVTAGTISGPRLPV
jgi:putative nucleotidyltransferase with HDIG domain